MRVLVVGAGASYAEGLAAGLPSSLRPPLIGNFASQLWADYNPFHLLMMFFGDLGIDPGKDPRQKFFDLEGSPGINIERFFEFAYQLREYRSQTPPAGQDWGTDFENLLHHGIFGPLTFLLITGLLKDDPHGAKLPVNASVARRLRSSDLVLNLNYDTLFEMAAESVGHEINFLPHPGTAKSLNVCKPHGSVNLLSDERRFYFARPLFNTVMPSDGTTSWHAFVPPRLNKHFDQHPIAAAILRPAHNCQPDTLSFWGVGLTESDADLIQIYRDWAKSALSVEFINPSAPDHAKAEQLLNRNVLHFQNLQDWLKHTDDSKTQRAQ